MMHLPFIVLDQNALTRDECCSLQSLRRAV